MSLLNRLNGLTSYKTIGELHEGVCYSILELRFKTTEYGRGVEAIIEAERGGERFRTFLPKRYSECFTETEIQQYNGEVFILSIAISNNVNT